VARYRPDVDLASAVARTFDLGPATGPAVAVEGGLINRMWRIDTTSGAYAAKQLAHTHPAARDDYRRAHEVEMAAIAAGLVIPQPVPNPRDGGPLADIDTSLPIGPLTVLLHRWVDGERLDPSAPVSAEVARTVAQDLARLHRIGLDPTAWPSYGIWHGAPTPETWSALARRIEGAGIDLPWSRDLVDHESDLRAMAERVTSEDGFVGATIVSHRDADAKNLMMVDGRAILIDWEVCGPTTVGHELGKSLLDLAGGSRGPILGATADALLDGYSEIAGPLPEPSSAWFAEWLMACASFAAYNADLVLTGADRREQDDRPSMILSQLLPALLSTATRWDELTEQLADLVSTAHPR